MSVHHPGNALTVVITKITAIPTILQGGKLTDFRPLVLPCLQYLTTGNTVVPLWVYFCTARVTDVRSLSTVIVGPS